MCVNALVKCTDSGFSSSFVVVVGVSQENRQFNSALVTNGTLRTADPRSMVMVDGEKRAFLFKSYQQIEM